MTGTGRTDQGLELLLDLDGERFVLESGYWVKFEVRRVPQSASIPHGVRYSMTLHDRANKRILGYDNAHEVLRRGRSGTAKPGIRDHRHYGRSVEGYDYKDGSTLLEDFFNDVDRILAGEKGQDQCVKR